MPKCLGSPSADGEGVLFELVMRKTDRLETHDLAGHRYARSVREQRLEVSFDRDGKMVPIGVFSIGEIARRLADPRCAEAPADEAYAPEKRDANIAGDITDRSESA